MLSRIRYEVMQHHRYIDANISGGCPAEADTCYLIDCQDKI